VQHSHRDGGDGESARENTPAAFLRIGTIEYGSSKVCGSFPVDVKIELVEGGERDLVFEVAYTLEVRCASLADLFLKGVSNIVKIISRVKD